MARLIDADALIGKFAERFDDACEQMHTRKNKDYWEGYSTGVNWGKNTVADAPTVKAVKEDDMRDFAEDVVRQFGYYGQHNGRLHIVHAGLSTLERAFDILGWENPHPVPECECEIDGCHEQAICGTPTKDGFKRVCGKHFKELQEEA